MNCNPCALMNARNCFFHVEVKGQCRSKEVEDRSSCYTISFFAGWLCLNNSEKKEQTNEKKERKWFDTGTWRYWMLWLKFCSNWEIHFFLSPANKVHEKWIAFILSKLAIPDATETAWPEWRGEDSVAFGVVAKPWVRLQIHAIENTHNGCLR